MASSNFSSSSPWIPNASPQDVDDAPVGVAIPDKTQQARNPEASWLTSPSPSPTSTRSPSPSLHQTDTELELPVPEKMQNQPPLLPATTRTLLPKAVDSNTSEVATVMAPEPQLVPLPPNWRQLKSSPRPFVGYGDLKSVSSKGGSKQSQGKENQQERRAKWDLAGKAARYGSDISEASTQKLQSSGSGQANALGTALQPNLRVAKPAFPKSQSVLPLSESWRRANLYPIRSFRRAQDGQQGRKVKYAEEKHELEIPTEWEERISREPYPRSGKRTASKIPRSNTFGGTSSRRTQDTAKPRVATPFWSESRWLDDTEDTDSRSDDELCRKSIGSEPNINLTADNDGPIQPSLKSDNPNGERTSIKIKESNTLTVETAQPPSYWLGRLMTMLDAYKYEESFHEPDPAVRSEVFNPASPLLRILKNRSLEEYRTKRAFKVLKAYCKTPEAKASLEEFRGQYVKKFGRRWSPWFGDEMGISRSTRNATVTQDMEKNSAKAETDNSSRNKRNTVGGRKSEFGFVNLIKSVRRSLG